ncbi:putative reverse transcriptase domain-containing protein [Tanacetum coccineum]
MPLGAGIIMVNVIPPNHDLDVPVVETNQHDDVPVVPEPIDIEEDENESELTYPYEEVDPLNPPPPASESEPDNDIEVENPIEHEDETVPISVYETAHTLVEKKGEAKDRFYDKLILDLGNEVCSSVEQGTTSMEKLVEKLENVKEKAECKKLKKELEEERLSNTFLRFVFEERLNEAIDVPIKDEKSPLSEPQGSPPDNHASKVCTYNSSCYSPNDQGKFDACNPAAFRGVEGAVELRRWFKKTESVFEISECAEGKKVKFAAATLEGPALTWWKTKVATMGLETVNQMPWIEMKQLMTAEFCPIEEIQHMEHELWNLKIKEYDIVAYTQRFNELALMCPRMVEPERVKVDAYIQGLIDNIKGEVTSSKPVDLNEAVRMAHKLMEQKSGKGNQKDNSHQTLQNNQKQGNARAMDTTPTDGKLPLCERCFTRHVGRCTIKCHKCGKVRHKARYCREKSVATGANTQPIWSCYDYGEQGHTRNRCPKKVKQEEVGEVRG